MKYVRFFFGIILCLLGVVLPYRARISYVQFLAAAVNLPFRLFGELARFLMKKLDMDNPYAFKQ